MCRGLLQTSIISAVTFAALLAAPRMVGSAAACPFCRPVNTTFTEDINAADVAALATLINRPERPDSSNGEIPAADIIDSYKATFRITRIYKGEEHAKVGQEVIAIYTGDASVGATCLIRGVQPEDLQWAPPIALSEQARQYVEKVLTLPKDGPERLSFFEDYLEHEDTTLRNDAFDEFARADYATLRSIKDHIDHDRLMSWIENPAVTPTNRRLYLSMLGVCGREDDRKKLEQMLASGDKDQLKGLDALIACYLILSGPDGLPLIEDQFLRGGVFWDPEYVETYAAIMALRFHGQESVTIPKDRLLAAMHIMLDRPELADLVIPDLARWEDWGAMDRLVQMFKESDKKSSWVRVPIVNYLRACPLQEAKDHLTELAKIDPDAIRRASTFFPFAPSSKKKDEAKKDNQGEDNTEAESNEGTETNKSEAGGAPKSSEKQELKKDNPITGASQSAALVEPPAAEAAAEAAVKAAAKAAAKTAEKPTAAVNEPSSSTRGFVLAAAIPLAVAVFLFVLMWMVLRRPNLVAGATGARHVL